MDLLKILRGLPALLWIPIATAVVLLAILGGIWWFLLGIGITSAPFIYRAAKYGGPHYNSVPAGDHEDPDIIFK